MKFLAILKDSVREALDTWVLYVMLSLNAVLILGVACLSFTPSSCKDLSPDYTAGSLERDATNQSKKSRGFAIPGLISLGQSSKWLVSSVEPLNGATDGPESALRFVIQRTYSTKEEAAAVQKDPEKTIKFITDNFGVVGEWKVLQVTSVDMLPYSQARTLSFEVKTNPTPATRRAWPFRAGFLVWSLPEALKTVPLGVQIWMIEDSLVNQMGGWVALLVSIILTSFFIPNMLRKGSIDLLLVKPIARPVLLLYKYLGGLTFMSINTAVAVGGVWLVLGLRSGIWSTGFLLTVLLLTFFFAILYALSTLFGVLTQSPIVAILFTCLAWLFFFSVGYFYRLPDGWRTQQQLEASMQARSTDRDNAGTDTSNVEPGWFRVVKALHFMTPRTSDLKVLTSRLLLNDTLDSKGLDPNNSEFASFSWPECLSINCIFVAVMLSLACLRFATKDY